MRTGLESSGLARTASGRFSRVGALLAALAGCAPPGAGDTGEPPPQSAAVAAATAAATSGTNAAGTVHRLAPPIEPAPDGSPAPFVMRAHGGRVTAFFTDEGFALALLAPPGPDGQRPSAAGSQSRVMKRLPCAAEKRT
ncbi:MAG: hypothetical protein AABZ30_13355, partial [Myxococcota bacterium]